MIFLIVYVGFPGQQRAKVAELTKFGRAVSGFNFLFMVCCLVIFLLLFF